jgi:hypothetical protein
MVGGLTYSLSLIQAPKISVKRCLSIPVPFVFWYRYDGMSSQADIDKLEDFPPTMVESKFFTDVIQNGNNDAMWRFSDVLVTKYGDYY